MDRHLKTLSKRYCQQFGYGPGLGLGSGTCLMNIENISSSLIRLLYKSAAGLYRTDPWKRLRPDHLFTLKVGKDSNYSRKKQPFPCVQFIGGNGGDLALYMFRSENDAKQTISSRETIRVPDVEIMRVTYVIKSLLFTSHKKMIASLSLETSGDEHFPVFDVCRCDSSGEILHCRNPTLEELKFVYGAMNSFSLVHPLLQEDFDSPKLLKFKPFIETIDIHWPTEISNDSNNNSVAVTISYPPGQRYNTDKVNSSSESTPSTTHSYSTEDENVSESRSTGCLQQCAQCGNEVSGRITT